MDGDEDKMARIMRSNIVGNQMGDEIRSWHRSTTEECRMSYWMRELNPNKIRLLLPKETDRVRGSRC